jgi:hypothetical protein
MSTKTYVLIAVAAFLAGYYLSAKLANSFIGRFVTPMA